MFRLVIIVVADEKFHSVFREEFFKLSAELGRQSLVMRNYKGGFLNLLDDISHGKGLPRTRNTEKCLVLHPVPDPLYQLFYRPGLIAG